MIRGNRTYKDLYDEQENCVKERVVDIEKRDTSHNGAKSESEFFV